ncbi:putative pre-rRNA-processing protein Ipi1 [Helianthus annuus]|nr:putative pre-rRNA-processing protein Ipi1 [Helianthus annuus]KAJ0564875.1 putative pre-rRNA-processing protein Ipi1 [Helianthus annuus]KAJ0571952.1 putative pre-rRNA-processing protein Ipi1 [Helianthus annuus]
MVKHKAQLKKRGVDFKKIKRKIGKKLRPPKNTTNTELKSKAIILPEQSLASEKAGLAVSKRGLTLKELLQQTSHHNAKVRRDALVGIRDIFLNHPSELKMHKLRVIEKLRERMSDEDKVVRETLYQLLKTVIFPACKEGNQGTFISLMMAYVFNAMTHLTIDVRLMAFKTFDLVVQHYPVSFSMFAEKIIQHYKEILQKNQFNLHDKGKLKSVLAGLAYCLSLLPCNTTDNNSSTDNAVADRRILHAFESETHKDHSGFSSTEKELKGLLPILISGIQDFMPSCLAMETQSYDCVLSILKSIDLVVKFFVNGKGRSAKQLKVSLPSNGSDQVVLQKLLKKLFVLFPLNPTHQSSEKVENRLFKLNVIVSEIFFCLYDWSAPPSVFLDKFLVFIIDALSEKVVRSGRAFFQKHFLSSLNWSCKWTMHGNHIFFRFAFTEVFKKCDPESSMKLVCLSAVEEMLFLKTSWVSPNTSDSEIIDFQISWIREIPLLLTLLGDKNPLATKDVLRLQLHLAQCGTHSQELDNMQYTLREFYSTCPCDGDISYGPFMKLGREIQELSVCCLYYFSFMDPSLLQSVAGCCLSHDLDPSLLFRFLEVLNCAYRAGHIQIADYISFLITLLSRYQVSSESGSLDVEICVKSNSELFRSVTSAVCSCLHQIGDDHLVFKMLEGAVVDQISNKPPLDNTCALLRMIITLDSNPTKLCEQSILKLGSVLTGYMIDVVSVSSLGKEDCGLSNGIHTSRSRYYILPCFLLFYRGEKILNHVLNVMSSFIMGNDSPTFDGQNGHVVMIDHLNRITAVVGILLLMNEDAKVWQMLQCYKKETDSILQNILTVMSDGDNLRIEEKHRVQCSYDRLKRLFTL